MRLLVLTSCTGEKAVEDLRHLTLADFKCGPAHVAKREKELEALLTPAAELYTGQQHVRLMRGIERHRNSFDIDLWVLSAGYGLVPGSRRLAPYEATFAGMKKAVLRQWADQLGVPCAVRGLLTSRYDLALVLLGDSYLAACALGDLVCQRGPAILFGGSGAIGKLPRISGLRTVAVTNREAKRFSCGLVALKGELAAHLLDRLAGDPELVQRLQDPATDVLGLLDSAGKDRPKLTRAAARASPRVDRVVSIPQAWWDKPHRARLRYFIPEWDDLVDPDYNFLTDTHSGGSGDWSNEVYAHQMYPEPNYDGILISKVVAEKSRKKKERINALGVHRFLRVPRQFAIMGDCGAFGYINNDVPPYRTEEILDYYSGLDFDFGVSIDHLIVTATESEKKARYNLTVENAAEFLTKHRKARLPWTPIGAVQGWDAKSYAAAAKKYVAMGYEYIGLGGLVRTSTSEILEVLQKVHEVVPANVKVHLFGLARIASMRAFADLGVRSVDSASLLRRAWMGTGQNYLSMEGRFYTAIRIPEAGKSFRAKRMVSDGRASGTMVERLEAKCMEAMARFDADKIRVEEVLEVLEEYDHLITPGRQPTRELLRETLEGKPWRACGCEICRRDGIQVVIFRGNNRNRRRGFHNTYVFYRLLQQALSGQSVGFLRSGATTKGQLTFLSSRDAVVEAANAV